LYIYIYYICLLTLILTIVHIYYIYVSLPYPSHPPLPFPSLPTATSLATGAVTINQASSLSTSKDTRNSTDFLHLTNKYVQALESDTRRALAAANSNVCCVYVLTSTDTAQCLVLPIEVPSQHCFIANASSNPAKLRPMKFGPEAFGAHYQLLPVEAFNKLKPKTPFAAGTPFTKSALPALQGLMPGNANKRFVFFIAANSNLGPFGLPGTASGSISDVTAALIEDAHPAAPIWLNLLTSYNVALGPAIAANMADVQQYLPTVPDGCTIHPSPSLQPVALTDEEEEGADFGPAVAELQAKLDAYRPAPPPQPDDASLISKVVITNPPTPQPPALTPTKPDDSAVELSDILTRYQLLLARVETADDGTQKVVLGKVDSTLERILAKQPKSNRAKALMGYILNTMKANEASVDYLERKVNWSGIREMAVAGWVLGCVFNPEPLSTIDELTSQQLGLSPCHFTRVTPKQAKESVDAAKQAQATRELEELIGMASNDPYRTRPITTAYANANMHSGEALLTCGANQVFMFQALGDFQLWGDDAPTFVQAMLKLCDASSTAPFLLYLSNHPHQAKYCYYLFSQFGTLLRTILAFASDQTNIVLAQDPATVSQINPAPLQEITSLTDIVLSSVVLFKSGSSDIPGTSLYESSNQYRDAKKRELTTLGFMVEADPSRKKTKTLEKQFPTAPTTPSSNLTSQPDDADKTGVVKSSTRARLPSGITIRNASNVPDLCIMHLRDGTACPYKAECRRSHADIKSWPVSLLEDWDKFIKSNATLSWNAAVIPPEIRKKLAIS